LSARELLRGLVALFYVLTSVPRIDLPLTDSPSGRTIRAFLEARRFGVRRRLVARGVLELPATFEHYFSGRSRHAVRTNRSRALKEGFWCGDLLSAPDAGPGIEALVAIALINPATLPQPSDERWLFVHGRDGRVAGGAMTYIDDDCAMICYLVARSYPVRYLVHTELVAALIASRVRYLLLNTPTELTIPPGLQYLRHLLGYRTVNLRVRT
jgi:hypothetical protein